MKTVLSQTRMNGSLAALLLGAMLLANQSCSNGATEKTTKATDQTATDGTTATSKRQGFPGGNVGAPPGGSMSRPGAGFYVDAPLKSGTSSGTGKYSIDNLSVECDKASSNQNIMELALAIKKSDGVQQYDAVTSFKSACINSAKITVANLFTGDMGTLTVTMKTLDGTAYATGVTAPFTQAEEVRPTTTGTTPSDTTTPPIGGNTGAPTQRQRPSATKIAIIMKDI